MDETTNTPVPEADALAAERESLVSQRARMVAEEQIRAITEMDGDIRSVEDLMNMPEYGDFYGRVQKGMSLVDAYKLTRWDALMDRTAKAAAREAMQSVASRQHLAAVAGQPGVGDFSAVPPDVAEGFRQARPGITDGEIRRRYRKYQQYKRQ